MMGNIMRAAVVAERQHEVHLELRPVPVVKEEAVQAVLLLRVVLQGMVLLEQVAVAVAQIVIILLIAMLEEEAEAAQF